jgi:PAS domain S-box-containing protein
MNAIDLLLIEDNPGDAELIREMLADDRTSDRSAVGFRLARVDRLSAGLAYLKDHQPDLALLDLSLPDSRDFETITRLRAGAPDVPIVVLTGRADETFALQAMHAGAQDYLVKGEIDSRLLKRTIRYALERHRLILDLKRQTQARLDSETRFHTMVEHNADGIVMVDSKGSVRFANPAAELLFGRPADELLGEAFDFPLPVEAAVELDITRRTGQHATVEMQVVDMAWGGETVYLASLRDITQRKQAEAERERLLSELAEERARLKELNVTLEERVAQRTADLQASEARFRAVFEEAAQGISLCDAEGRILASNPAFQAMLGYSAEDLGCLSVRDLTHPGDRAADAALFREILSGERDTYHVEKRYVRQDGAVVWGSLVVSAVRGPGGEFRFAVRMVQDVTQQKHIRDALVRSEKLAVAGKLAASLTHEIKNPLQSVIGCVALAQEAVQEGGDPNSYLNMAGEELWRTVGIVDQLRDLHRPPEAVTRRPSDVNALVERVIALNEPRCRQRGVEVAWQPGRDLPPVLAAPGQLQQVFLNLVLNALEAMSRGGWLYIRTEASGDPAGVRVRFVDTGPGIPEEALSHIFEPFYTTREDGLGLGLYICHSIVAEHGGCIEVESRPGQGAAFSIWLPGAEATR